MSKRKAPEPTDLGGKAAGKRRAEDEVDGLDMLGDGPDLTEVVDNVGDLAEAIGDDDGDDDNDEDALLAAALGGDDDDDEDGGDDGDDDGADDDEPLDVAPEATGPALPEPGELPDGVTEDQLTSESSVDLTGCGELTLAQARRVAQHLAQNSDLSSIKVGSCELSVGDLADDDELEWDSEEYTNVEAIILAELLKKNTSVARLDLARNQIGDAGAVAIALMLAENATIEYLNLESNTFGPRGGEAFLEALTSNTKVQYLNLMYNAVPSTTQAAIKQEWQRSRGGIGLHL